MLGKAANRVHDTAAHLASGERDAAHFVARAVGTSLGVARGAIATAAKLEALPATDALVREGRLSSRQAELIANTAALHPDAEERLLAAADLGTKALQDACLNVPAAGTDPAKLIDRQQRSRFFRTWSTDDGMVEGRFRVTPEIGGQINTVVENDTQQIFRAHH